MPTVLFLCTGNYYRSRFAEAVFNHRAEALGLSWSAKSRGIQIDRSGAWLVGPISPFALKAIESRGISYDEVARPPADLTYGDLASAELIVGLKEAEHRAMLEGKFPGWGERLFYWHIHDVDQATPEVALAEIEANVERLIGQLRVTR